MKDLTMTEELEQLLKNLKLRRTLEVYDEQLRATDKEDIRDAADARSGRRGGKGRWSGGSVAPIAGTLDAGNVSVRPPARRES
jgi:hypothetical protein